MVILMSWNLRPKSDMALAEDRTGPGKPTELLRNGRGQEGAMLEDHWDILASDERCLDEGEMVYIAYGIAANVPNDIAGQALQRSDQPY